MMMRKDQLVTPKYKSLLTAILMLLKKQSFNLTNNMDENGEVEFLLMRSIKLVKNVMKI